MKRHEVIAEIAQAIYEQHDADLIGYIIGSTEPLSTWSTEKLVEVFESLDSTATIEIVDERATQFADLDHHEAARVELATYIAEYFDGPDSALILAALEAFAEGVR
jgi:hypothetical protein